MDRVLQMPTTGFEEEGMSTNFNISTICTGCNVFPCQCFAQPTFGTVGTINLGCIQGNIHCYCEEWFNSRNEHHVECCICGYRYRTYAEQVEEEEI